MLNSSLKVFKLIIILLSLAICLGADAQKEGNAFTAKAHLNNIKNNVLLIRLESGNKRYDMLMLEGLTQKAKAFIDRLRLKNQGIIDAFKYNYNFSDYLFFYSEDSEKIKEGDFEKALFNSDLKRVNKNPSIFYILDAKGGFFKNFQTSYVGFAVLDKNFKQLEKPFPYYVEKKDGSLFFRRSNESMVKILNNNFTNYSIN